MSEFSVELLKRHPGLIKLMDGSGVCAGCGSATLDATPISYAKHCVEVAEQTLLHTYTEVRLVYDNKQKRMTWQNVPKKEEIDGDDQN